MDTNEPAFVSLIFCSNFYCFQFALYDFFCFLIEFFKFNLNLVFIWNIFETRIRNVFLIYADEQLQSIRVIAIEKIFENPYNICEL